MSPQSNSSSLEAQDGSADSSYPANAATSRNPPQRRMSDLSAASYDRQNRNTAASVSTNAHQDYATSDQNYSSSDQYTSARSSSQEYTSSEPHYYPVYDPVTPRYENELTFDDDQNTAAAAAAETPPYGGRYTRQAPEQNQSYQDYQNSQSNQTNGSHSPTTERWTAEQSSEERIRLGLSRYPTEEERRLAYENTVEHESHRRH
ncbi:hypothetical protein BKA65DRAFT_236789 [Rhexocercosporidium sp. MPI-PUGE-AT-0058]|nr:hypothetical protein BKA65DRAFT_236789 [Rhexocercosporidium sp. MPI-PUGE-AT-0058]